MGHIYKRGDTYWVKYYRNGKAFFESTKSTKEGDAKTMLKLREGDIAKGVAVTPRAQRYAFEDARQAFLDHRKANGIDERSLKKTTRRIDMHLGRFFAKRKMTSITGADVSAYVARRLEQQAQTSTINRELTILKKMFTLAMNDEIIFRRPKIAMLVEDNVRKGFIEDEHYHAIVKRLSPVLADVVTFAYITGWRVASEVLPLEWRQIDLKAGTVRLEPGTTKNKEGRLVFMSDDLRIMLERRAKERDALREKTIVSFQRRKEEDAIPWVFWRMVAKGRGGKKYPKPVRAFGKAWKNATKDAGVPDRILHDLRRSAVRNMVRAGIPERVAMQLTGHKTRSVFERYNIVSEGDLRAAAHKLGIAPKLTKAVSS